MELVKGNEQNSPENNYYYGKMIDGDLTEIEYKEGGRSK